MNSAATPTTFQQVACPFCGLVCDDLEVEIQQATPRVARHGCERARRLFALAGSASCSVAGKPASLDEALAHAGAILAGAHAPVFVSAGADVASMRALLALAERCQATVEHVSEGLMRNVLALQDSGWITTTLSEIRNRADFLLCVGTDVVSRFPRFFERCAQGGGLFEAQRAAPELYFLGAAPPAGLAARHLALPPGRLPETLSVLRALVAGKAPHDADPALIELALRAQQARYGVALWAAADFDYPHAELTVRTLCDCIKDLNAHTRFAGLALGGTLGDITAHQVITWQTGVTLRTRFTDQGPCYDPRRQALKHLLERDALDALLCVSEWDSEVALPSTRHPSIVLGRAGDQAPACTVFIPVGVPGIDRAGHMCRTDNVVTLPLKQVVERGALSAPRILTRLLAALP